MELTIYSEWFHSWQQEAALTEAANCAGMREKRETER